MFACESPLGVVRHVLVVLAKQPQRRALAQSSHFREIKRLARPAVRPRRVPRLARRPDAARVRRRLEIEALVELRHHLRETSRSPARTLAPRAPRACPRSLSTLGFAFVAQRRARASRAPFRRRRRASTRARVAPRRARRGARASAVARATEARAIDIVDAPSCVESIDFASTVRHSATRCARSRWRAATTSSDVRARRARARSRARARRRRGVARATRDGDERATSKSNDDSTSVERRGE